MVQRGMAGTRAARMRDDFPAPDVPNSQRAMLFQSGQDFVDGFINLFRVAGDPPEAFGCRSRGGQA